MIQELSTCNLQSNIGLCKSENVATPASGVRISKSLTDPSPNPKKQNSRLSPKWINPTIKYIF